MLLEIASLREASRLLVNNLFITSKLSSTSLAAPLVHTLVDDVVDPIFGVVSKTCVQVRYN